jgi:hypothetical protein
MLTPQPTGQLEILSGKARLTDNDPPLTAHKIGVHKNPTNLRSALLPTAHLCPTHAFHLGIYVIWPLDLDSQTPIVIDGFADGQRSQILDEDNLRRQGRRKREEHGEL